MKISGFQQSYVAAGFLTLGIALVLTTGCGSKSGTLTTTTGVQNFDHLLQTRELIDVTELATLPRPDVFQSLLAPEPTALPDIVDVEPPPPADPFEGIVLSGIIFNDTKPLVILSPDKEAPTQILKKGDVFQAKNGQVTVVNIAPKSVTLATDASETDNTTELEVASLIGHRSDTKTSSKPQPAEQAETSPNTGESSVSVSPESSESTPNVNPDIVDEGDDFSQISTPQDAADAPPVQPVN